VPLFECSFTVCLSVVFDVCVFMYASISLCLSLSVSFYVFFYYCRHCYSSHFMPFYPSACLCLNGCMCLQSVCWFKCPSVFQHLSLSMFLCAFKCLSMSQSVFFFFLFECLSFCLCIHVSSFHQIIYFLSF
jgi:hypothetical protein